MAFYTIKPIRAGSIWYYKGGFTARQTEYLERELFPVIVFLIEGNGRKILVDTGCGDPAIASMKETDHGGNILPAEERPDRALLNLGVQPEEIDTVIMTHLHWDHCYNNQYFPSAKFYVQRKELQYAVAPLPKFKTTYEAFETGVIPAWARQKTKWVVVDGDHQLMEGIRLICIPGHTPGLQGVLVDTEKGRYFLASDALPLYESFASEDFLVSPLCADLEAFYRSFQKIKALNATIIPSHDPLVLSHERFPI